MFHVGTNGRVHRHSHTRFFFKALLLNNVFSFIVEHEEKQNRFRALRNRQDLFQEEGILNLILEAIDKINVITSQGFMVNLAGDESGQNWDIISGYLYQLLGMFRLNLTQNLKYSSKI